MRTGSDLKAQLRLGFFVLGVFQPTIAQNPEVQPQAPGVIRPTPDGAGELIGRAYHISQLQVIQIVGGHCPKSRAMRALK